MSSTDPSNPPTSLMTAGGSPSSMDNAKWNKLHTLAAFCTLGGTALDGYILGLVGGSIGAATAELHFTPLTQGLVGASALIGIFIGGVSLGNLADRFGRRRVFQWNLIAFVILSILQLFAVGTWDLTVYRVLMGVAIGVEYAVGAALLSELVPTKNRGPLLASLQATWFVGFVAANFVALGFADVNWRLVLASSAIPAVIIAIARIKLPESPRWLVTQGREKEAQSIIDRHFPADTTLPTVDATEEKGRFVELFSKRHRQSTAYSSIFWACQVAPLFAIFTFITPVLNDIGLPSGFSRDFIMNMLQLVGAIIFIWIVAVTRRRGLAIWTFAIMLLALLVLGVFPSAPLFVLAAAAGVYLFVAAGSANLEFVYPSEMFPTRLRSSGVGFASAMSRVGAALATYLLPFLISTIGISLSLIALAGFSLIGLLASIAWAPETSKSAIR